MVHINRAAESRERRGVRPAELPSRLPSLTGMRFVAAGMVFFFHFMWLWPTAFASPVAQTSYLSLFYQGGWAGVSFFFVLSGFVLAWAVRPTDTARTFWRRRFFKIYPNHLVTFLAAFVLLASTSQMTFGTWDAVTNLTLVQAWFPQMETRHTFNQVAWSLSCEALFYFAFPFLMRLIVRIRPERLWAWAAGVVAAIFAIAFIAKLLPEQPPFPVTQFTAWEMWFVDEFPPARMLEFVFGILMAQIVMSGRRLPLGLGGAVTLAVAAYVVAPLLPPTLTFAAVMVLPIGLVIAAGAAADVAGRPTMLSSRPMVWLGEVSFAMYMVHHLFLTYSYRWLGAGHSWRTLPAIGVLALLLGSVVVLSWLLHVLVERPVMRRFGSGRRRTPATVVPLPVGPVQPVGEEGPAVRAA
jgi:peptidoglycan/LPS O-acetylase OafA/YrhL